MKTWTILTPAIRCPACGAAEGERRGKYKILKVVGSRTIGRVRMRYVICRACGAVLRVAVRLDWRPGDGDTVSVRDE